MIFLQTNQANRRSLLCDSTKKSSPGLYPLYHVIVVFNNLELLAGGTSDLAKAVDLHMALTSLKQRILKTPSLWYRLRDELEKVMLEHDLLLSHFD